MRGKTRVCGGWRKPLQAGFGQDGLMKLGKNRGFSLLELMITLSIVLVMAGVTFMALMPMFKQNKVDAAYDTTLSVIRTYRSQAITQSKRYIITFTAPGTIEVQYWGVGVPVSPAPVTVATYQLPTDIQFAVQAGFPASAPDGFGGGSCGAPTLRVRRAT